MKDLVVVATITAKEGNEVLVREALERIVPPSRAEAGCIRYDLHIDLDHPREAVPRLRATLVGLTGARDDVFGRGSQFGSDTSSRCVVPSV